MSKGSQRAGHDTHTGSIRAREIKSTILHDTTVALLYRLQEEYGSVWAQGGFSGGPSGKEPVCQCWRQIQIQSLGQEDPLEEDVATYSSLLAWRIPWTEEPGGLQSIGWQRVRHDWSDWARTHMSPRELLVEVLLTLVRIHKNNRVYFTVIFLKITWSSQVSYIVKEGERYSQRETTLEWVHQECC